MTIALVAHDARKKELIDWARYNWSFLLQHKLVATGTTGRLLREMFREVTAEYDAAPFNEDNLSCLLSGPLGGDQMIGAMIAEQRVDVLIFFCDSLITQGHQNDINALTRLASLYNIGLATNRTTADLIITSKKFESILDSRKLPKVIEDYKNRAL